MFDGELAIMADDSAIIRSNPRYIGRPARLFLHVAEIKKLSLRASNTTVNHYFNYGRADVQARRMNNKYSLSSIYIYNPLT